MTFQDLRNDGFTVMKHENINIMATEFHIQKKWPVVGKEKKKRWIRIRGPTNSVMLLAALLHSVP